MFTLAVFVTQQRSFLCRLDHVVNYPTILFLALVMLIIITVHTIFRMDLIRYRPIAMGMILLIIACAEAIVVIILKYVGNRLLKVIE